MGASLLATLLALSVLAMLASPSAAFSFSVHNLQDESVQYAMTAVCISEDHRGLRAHIELKSEGLEKYGPSVKNLVLNARWESEERFRVHLTSSDRQTPRWEVPQHLLPRPPVPEGSCNLHPVESLDVSTLHHSSPLAFSFTRAPFGFAVRHRSSGEVLFNSTPPQTGPSFSPLIFKDQYLELSTSLPPSASLYGLGESTHPSGLRLKPNQTYTLWASDISASTRDIPLYGVHPFYIDLREDGAAHGVLFLNSNGIDASLAEDALTLRAIGGVIDLYFFAGPTPLRVVEQYTDLVGKPAPVPYWALGFHQCRWGYRSLEELRQVAANYSAAQIPLDTLWSDIDYMDQYKDFTTDPVNYPQKEMQQFVDELHKAGQHYVAIVDPGIKVEAGYPAYERGLKSNVFIRYPDGTPMLGQVWPGPVHFPDFVMNPATADYWQQELARFHEMVPYDGLWIDMNEASNFCSAIHCTLPPSSRPPPVIITNCFLDCSNETGSKWDQPPYRLKNLGNNGLGYHTIPMSALHHGNVRAYDVHNLYGLAEGRTTHLALRNIVRKRPFVLSRSTFSGAGKWTAHWSGDNTASWDDFRFSIVSILNMGLFGVPHVGADICGFIGTTTEELCLRWIQAGAFYPFSRDHNNKEAAPQELYRWPSVTLAARAALGLRYQLLPFLYTLTFQAQQTGRPLARPLFMEFPRDLRTRTIDGQFLLGGVLLVSPVLSPGAKTVEAYFPKGTWYSQLDDSRVVSKNGTTEVLPSPWDKPAPVHVRGGQILPLQQGGMTTAAARKTPFLILVPLPDASSGDTALERGCANSAAEWGEWVRDETLMNSAWASEDVSAVERVCAAGELFLDSGDDLEMKVAAPTSTYLTFRAAATLDTKYGVVESVVDCGEFAQQEKYVVDVIVVLGVKEQPKTVLVNGHPDVGVQYDGDRRKLIVPNLGLQLSEPFHLHWGTVSTDKRTLEEAI